MRWLGKGRFRFFRGQTGFTLIEVLVAVVLLGLIGGGVATALDTNSRATRVLDEQVVAVNLATAHFEAIRELPFSTDNYSGAGANITIPSQYFVDIDVDYSDDGTTWSDNYTSSNQTLQRITISVSREGGKSVFSTCTYRTLR